MPQPFCIAPALLAWFQQSRRSLPFRSDPTPYHVWVSEIMLQQTRVSAALPFYERFIRELPDIPALAACDEERLHKLWEGLGYYSRVRNLQKAARMVCEQYGGELPGDLAALRTLPGIGDYTAGAVASIGFGIAAPAVDGNVLRVFARLLNDDADILLPETKKRFTQIVMEQQPPQNPGDFNQALMELGALICLPNGEPKCGDCPLAGLCRAHAAGRENALPTKTKAKARKRYALTLALVEDEKGRWLLQKRPETGLLAGLWQPPILSETLLKAGSKGAAAPSAPSVPSAPSAPAGLSAPGALSALPSPDGLPDPGASPALPSPDGLPDPDTLPAPDALPVKGAVLCGEPPIRAVHIFTHLEWQMTARHYQCPCQPAPTGCVFASADELKSTYTLPGAFKAFRAVMH